MTITPEQIVDSLIELAGNMVNDLYEFKCEFADDYNNQLQEIFEQYREMTK